MTIVNRQSSIGNRPDRLFTFASGGWVILLTLMVCLLIAGWALRGAVMRMVGASVRPPGDGKTIESFKFDLSNLSVPRDLIAPAMLHRGMVPVMLQAAHSGPTTDVPPEQRWEAMQRTNDPPYGKYLVPSDIIIGVEIDGESRAYPLHVLYVHEIINDVLAGTPIVVTYHWPCASAVVFDRRVNPPLQGTAVFGASGLVYNSNLLMYDINQTRTSPDASEVGGGNESLWCQLTGRPISGSSATLQSSLTIIPSEVVTWADWSARHPDTTVVNRDLSMFERYKDAAPTQYFRSPKILFPVSPMPPTDSLDLKTRVLAVVTSESARVYPLPYVLDHATPMTGELAGLVEWQDTLGGRRLRFIGDRNAGTLRVASDPLDPPMLTFNAFWFAWHAMHPQDELFQPQQGG